MNAKRRTFLVAAILVAVVLLCVAPAMKDASPAPGGTSSTNDSMKVDFDFTSMNATIRATYMYRLAAVPSEFEGKTLRVSGTFLTRVDKEDGKRYFGCLIGDSGGCSCCSAGGVLEFLPKDCYVWPTNFPQLESRVTITGRLKMFEVGNPEQSFTIPRLVDADIFKSK